MKWARRRPAVAALAASVVLVAAVSFAVVAAQLRETRLALAAAKAAGEGEPLPERPRPSAGCGRAAALREPIGLAHAEYQANNLARYEQVLDRCRADFRGWEWNYLYRLAHREILTVPNLGISCTGLVLQPRRDTDRPGNMGGEVILLDARTGRRLRTFTSVHGFKG